jgi:phenylacetate-coenzyme A ligase PaaK-like adenylate-forming protein
VVVVADDKDLFWIAKVTDADDEKVALRYYHYMINRNEEKIYKLHNSTGSCGPADIISYFSTEDRIFTKNGRIRKASLKKIQKEYYIYTGKKIQ